MAKVALLTIHGMGDTNPSYANKLKQRLRERIGSRFNDVAVVPVCCQDVLHDSQQQIWNGVTRRGKVHYDDLRKFLLYGMSDVIGRESGKERSGSVYEITQIAMARAMLEAREQLGGDGPLVFITQSQGGQLLSNYLYDAQKATLQGAANVGIWRNLDDAAPAITGRRLSTEERNFLAGATVRRWLSTGCNIPMFMAAHRRMDIKPIAPPSEGFRWLNIYDPDDVLGWPLQPLSDDYAALVEDRVISAGQGFMNWITKSWSANSHSIYWDDEDVLTPLSGFLREFL